MTNSQPPLTSTENQAIVKPTPVPNPLPTPTPVSVSDSVDAEAVYWNEIEKRNTKSGFELYLAEYPNGRFAKTAKDRIAEESRKKEEIKSAREQAKWDEVSTLNGKSAYQAYLADYPNGKYSYIAKAKIKESENEEARILLKTVAGYRGYLSIYANGEFASLARLRLSDLGEVVTVSISAGTVTTNSLGMKVI